MTPCLSVDGGFGRKMPELVRVVTGALIHLHQDVTSRDGTQTVYSVVIER